MRIGIIYVDGHNFPNLPLMKISAWHKAKGDSVEWYEPLLHGFPNEPMDVVYMSKVFSFSPDYTYHINAKSIVKGGSGYCISLVGGKEVFDKSKHEELPEEIERIYPDYSIYYEQIPEVKDTAYGFLTRGCPRGCNFCHVADKEGKCSAKVAELADFWRGQKNIVLLDPNITASPQCKPLFQQLIDSKAWIDFSQGLDIRLLDEEKADMLLKMKIKQVHFAWDNYRDKDIVVPKFKWFKEKTGWSYQKMTVYMLCNFDTTFEQDLDRVYTLRDLGYNPFVMLYDKENIPKADKLRHLQRWVNNRIVFRSCEKFEDFDSSK